MIGCSDIPWRVPRPACRAKLARYDRHWSNVVLIFLLNVGTAQSGEFAEWCKLFTRYTAIGMEKLTLSRLPDEQTFNQWLEGNHFETYHCSFLPT